LLATGSDVEIERRLYVYIKSHEGNIHIPEAAYALGEPPARIREAVDRLVSEGRIVVE
jgi:hypothetical protein